MKLIYEIKVPNMKIELSFVVQLSSKMNFIGLKPYGPKMLAPIEN